MRNITTRVVNLTAQPERYREFRHQWARSGWGAVLPDPIRFEAVDGTRERIPAEWERFGEGAWGCWASHLQLLRLAHARGTGVAVFEDDALIPPDSADELAAALAALPANAAGLWLGGQIVESSLEDVTSPIFRVHRAPLRTHAYLLTADGVECALRHLPHSVNHVDMSFGRALAGCAVYAAHPWLVGQRAGRSTITHAQEPERWWPLAGTTRS